MDEITTTDLSKFGYRERKMAAELLTASVQQGLPEEWDCSGVTVMMNAHSGNVFLTNEDFQVAMMNGNRLEEFYSCPECGYEGFYEDMANDHDHDENPDCREYAIAIGILPEEASRY